MDLVSIIGSMASIIGLGLSGWVLWRVNGIRRTFLLRARLPDLMRKISGHRSRLSLLLNSFSGNEPDISSEISRCKANLENLKSKLYHRQADNVVAAIDVLDEINRTRMGLREADVRRLYARLLTLESDLNNLWEDMKWGTRT